MKSKQKWLPFYLCALVMLAITFSQTPTANAADSWTTLMTNHSPQHWWRLGETSGTVAADSAGSNNGTYQNGVTLNQTGAIDGDSDKAARFDGSNDEVNIGTGVDISGSAMTILAWVKADNINSGDRRIINKASGHAVQDNWWMIHQRDSRITFRLKLNGTTTELETSSGTLIANEWFFVVATYDGSQMRIYINSNELVSTNATGSISTDNSIQTYIGDSPAGSRNFDGTIDEVALFNKALSLTEIQALYQSALPPPNIYYVRPDGSDSNSGDGPGASDAWQTINGATQKSALIPGDIIYVKAGTYTEKVSPYNDGTASQPIQLIADRDGTVSGWSAGDVILQAPTSDEALSISDDPYWTVKNFKIYGVTGERAVYIYDSNGTRLENCEITNAGTDGVYMSSSSGVTLINCLIHNNGDTGVELAFSGGVDIWNCTVTNNNDDGVLFWAGSSTVRNSIITFNGDEGLQLLGGSVTHSYNIIYSNTDGNYYGTSQGTGELVTDPKFVATGNYHLASDSPAINAGTDATGIVDEDFDGLYRPIGGSWDIGCYEFPLLGFWKFDETSGTTAADSSGQSNDGTVNGSAVWTSRCNGGAALAFDGTSAYVQVTGTSVLNTQDSVSVAVWAKSNTKTWNADGMFISKRDQFMLYPVSGTEKIRFYIHNGSWQYVEFDLATLTSFALTGWHHYAGVYDHINGTIKLYVDGKLLATNSLGSGGQLTSDTGDIFIGKDDGNSAYFNGQMYNVRLYGAVLLPSEIASLYGLIGHWKFDETSGTTAADDSIAANDASLTGGGTWAAGKVDGAINFNGTSDYATTSSSFSPPTAGTIAFWMNVTSAPSTHGRILGLSDYWEVRHVTTGSTETVPYGLVFDVGTTGDNTEFVTTSAITSGWHYIAATYDTTNDSYAVYVDGLLQASGTHSDTLNLPPATQLSFGIRTGTTDYWKGTLDDVRIYNRVLCSDEINGIMSSGVGGIRILKWKEIK